MSVGFQAEKCRRLAKLAKVLAFAERYDVATKMLFAVCRKEDDLVGAFFIRCLLREARDVHQAAVASWMFREFLSETIRGMGLADLFLHEFKMHIRTGNKAGLASCSSRMACARKSGMVTGISLQGLVCD